MQSTDESVDTPMAPNLENEEFTTPESVAPEEAPSKSKHNVLVGVLIVFIVLVLGALGFYIFMGMQNPAPVIETPPTETAPETTNTTNDGPSQEVIDRMMQMHRDESSLNGEVMVTMENMQNGEDEALNQEVLDRMRAMNPGTDLPTLDTE